MKKVYLYLSKEHKLLYNNLNKAMNVHRTNTSKAKNTEYIWIQENLVKNNQNVYGDFFTKKNVESENKK